MKTTTANKKILAIAGLVSLIILLILSAFVGTVLFGNIYEGPSPFIIPIDENNVIQQVNENSSVFDVSDYKKIKFICDDLSLQNRDISNWATNIPSYESIQYMKELDDKALNAAPYPFVILSDPKSNESEEAEANGIHFKLGVIEASEGYEKAYYGICYIYDSVDPHIYLSNKKTPEFYDSPMYLNYIEKVYDNLYLYIYYTTRNPMYE